MITVSANPGQRLSARLPASAGDGTCPARPGRAGPGPDDRGPPGQLAVSRRITLPVARLIEVARAMGGGDRSARAGDVRGSAELRDLSLAFHQMADSLASQEKLRRNLVADVAHELRTPIAVLQAGHAKRCWTAWPSRLPGSWRRCAMRSCGWPASSTTCAPWPRPGQRHCS
ncbi:MAG TPA: HAMP domain-containing protein [Streptosporangiaceae bacterium]|nr:HAMP domain-containing protein [Streptosporangiaceae bacterium]